MNMTATLATTSYVYAGSRLISTETDSGTTYVTVDHLGSTRVTTDGGGNVTSRKDFMAFGEEAITVERNVGVGYGVPPVRLEWLSGADAAWMWFWGSMPVADAMGYML